MKREFSLVLIISAVYLLTACTLIQDLIVVNSSDEEIEIQYELKQWERFHPEITSVGNLNAWKILQKDWDKMPGEQFGFDEKAKTFKVKVKPRQAVKIGWGDPYHLEKEDDYHFNFQTLKIKGDNKEIYFETSSKLLDEFRKNDFRIVYR
jgi:hypothetical protein